MARQDLRVGFGISRVRRTSLSAAVIALLLSGCAVVSHPSAPAYTPTSTPPDACGPLDSAHISGAGPRSLTRFENDTLACGGRWLKGMHRGFVPQALALAGGTVWVSGWRFDRHRVKTARSGFKWCGLMQIDQRSGKVLRASELIGGTVEGRLNYCRHGGGLSIDEHGLWLVETRRLWLLDPARIGQPDQVIRGWAIRGATGSGSLIHEGRIGVVGYRPRRPGRIVWFSVADVLAPGVTRLSTRHRGPSIAADVATQQIASRTQSATWREGGPWRGLWLSRSTSRCGFLERPDGRTVGFVPGAEDIEFDPTHNRLWVVTESGSRPYQRKGGRPVVPGLLWFQASALSDAAASVCAKAW